MTDTEKENKEIYNLVGKTYNNQIEWYDKDTHFIGKVISNSDVVNTLPPFDIWLLKLNGELIFNGDLIQIVNDELLDLLKSAIKH